MDQEFLTNLVRAALAEAHFQSSLIASREMFGRSYFSLGASEKLAVDRAVFGFLVLNYQAITPEFLANQQAQRLDPGATQSGQSS